MQMLKLWLAFLLAGIGAVVPIKPASGPAAATLTAASQPAQVASNIEGSIAAHGSAPRVAPISLTLSGEVVDLANGEHLQAIEVRVGTRTLPVSVSGTSYSVSVSFAAPGDMVVVDSFSTRAHYRTHAGSMARLKRESKGDGHVSAVDSPSLRVSALRAANAVMQTHLLGREPATDQEMDATQDAVHLMDLFTAGSALRSFTDQSKPLPTGFATGLDVLRDQEAYRATLVQSIQNGRALTWAAVSSDLSTQLIAAPVGSLDELPHLSLLRTASPAREQSFTESTMVLERQDDGRFMLHENVGVRDPLHDAMLEPDGTVRLKPVRPRITQVLETTTFTPPNIPTRIDRQLDYIRLRRWIDGPGTDVWSVHWHYTDTYPNAPAQMPREWSNVGAFNAKSLVDSVRLDAWADLETRLRTFPATCLNTTQAIPLVELCDTAEHRFDPGNTGVTQDVGYKMDDRMLPRSGQFGVGFAWARAPGGGLLLDFGNRSLALWPISGSQGVDTIVYVARHISGGVILECPAFHGQVVRIQA